jgi:hypothetical protein
MAMKVLSLRVPHEEADEIAAAAVANGRTEQAEMRTRLSQRLEGFDTREAGAAARLAGNLYESVAATLPGASPAAVLSIVAQALAAVAQQGGGLEAKVSRREDMDKMAAAWAKMHLMGKQPREASGWDLVRAVFDLRPATEG